MHVRLGNTTQLRQFMQLPTQSKAEMEQTKLHTSQLVKLEKSIYPFFLNMQTEKSSGSHVKAETQRGKPYHKTIAAVFLASLLEVRDNKRPNPDDVANNNHQPRQKKSRVSIARRKDFLDCNQSQCSAPLRRVTMNSVIEKGSSVSNTKEAVFCRNRLSNLTSKVG